MVRSGFVGFWRNAFVSVAAIFVMTVALFVIGASLLVGTLLEASLEQIQSKVDINVYFVPEAAQEDIIELQTELEALPEVVEVTFTSREEALANFEETHRNDTSIIQGLDQLGDNPLGASLSIRARETSQYESIARFLEEQRTQSIGGSSIIDEVNFFQNKDSIDKLTTIIAAAEQAALVVMAVLVAAAVLITFNTIRLAIYTTREEISVMRLVGASNMFIRGPFMLQGVIYGLLAGVLALLILYPIVLWLGPGTEEFFDFNIFNYFVRDFPTLFGTLVGAGVVLGLISSIWAVSRYLRV